MGEGSSVFKHGEVFESVEYEMLRIHLCKHTSIEMVGILRCEGSSLS